jgi:cytochrome c oxidase assembly factor CtaG/cytochrome c2
MMLHTGAAFAAGVPIAPACGLTVAAVLYVRGVRGVRPTRQPQALYAFIAGWLALGLAVASPLHAAGERLLSMHMIQHVLIMGLAAPLLVWSRPLPVLLRGLPPRVRFTAIRGIRAVHGITRRLTTIIVACVIQAIVFWGWHLPALYDAGVEFPIVHALEHTLMFGAALLFWSSIPLHRRATESGRPQFAAAIAALFMTTLQMGILAGLMTFSRVPWYDAYISGSGLQNAAADQQLAGIIMWIPGGIPYVTVALVLLYRLLTSPAARRDARYLRQPVHQALCMLALAGTTLMLASCNRPVYDEGNAITGGDARHGKALISRYGCTACHIIPGVDGGAAHVGPRLDAVRKQAYVAGVLPNTPDNLVRWIHNPKQVDSLTAMPYLGVSLDEARDIASYLYSIR